MIGIKNSIIISFNPFEIQEGIDLVIDKNKILDKGKNILKDYPNCDIIEENKIVTPGIVCSHTHIYSALARGLNVKLKKSKDFVQILQNLWWILDKALDKDMVEASAQTCAIEAILCGVTTLIDHHSSPNFIEGSLKVIKKSFEDIGIRSILCYETTDRNGLDKAKEAIYENENFAKYIDEEKKNKQDILTEAAIGAHAPFTLSNDTLKELAYICQKTNRGIHIHVNEDKFDASYSRFSFEKDAVKRLYDFDLLDEKSILVHGVYISEEEVQLINEKDAFLVHNARSNMNNNVGYNRLLDKYKNLAIGTDGINHDLICELQTSFFKHKDFGGVLQGNDFVKMLYNGNILLNRYFDKMQFGKVEKDYIADLVIWDYNAPTEINAENISSHMIFGFNSGFVKTVIINGKVILKDRKFNFDIKPIFENSKIQGKRLTEEMDKMII